MALSFDPTDMPVIGIDGHLPAVDALRFSEQAFRQRFRAPPAWTPETTQERRADRRASAQASVLIAVVLRDEPTVLLTQRTDHLTNHPGQISFPGGRAETYDADAIATALREAEEEIGLSREYVEVLGTLPLYTTVTAFHVTPVVALVRPGFTLTVDPSEVAEAFEVPLAFLMNPANHHRHRIDAEGGHREFLSMPWVPPALREGGPSRYFIWGATAAMLRNLYRFLAA